MASPVAGVNLSSSSSSSSSFAASSLPLLLPSSSSSPPCPSHPLAFECDHPSCCASYQQRFLMLLLSLGVFAVALIVAAVWMAIEWRPRRWRLRTQRGGKRMSEVEIRSCEETRYLRRMSELNPNVRREIVE